jgi:hypothetical protein
MSQEEAKQEMEIKEEEVVVEEEEEETVDYWQDVPTLFELIEAGGNTDITEAAFEELKKEIDKVATRIEELEANQTKLLQTIIYKSKEKEKSALIKEKIALGSVLKQSNAAFKDHQKKVDLFKALRTQQQNKLINELDTQRQEIIRKLTEENNIIVNRQSKISRAKANTLGDLKEARCGIGITNLGFDLFNNNPEELKVNGWKPSECHLAPQDAGPLLTQIRQQYADEIRTHKKVALLGLDAEPKPYLNALLKQSRYKITQWPLNQLFLILEAYDKKPLPQVLEKYRVFTDIALWNGGLDFISNSIGRNNAIAEAVHEEQQYRLKEEKEEKNKPKS